MEENRFYIGISEYRIKQAKKRDKLLELNMANSDVVKELDAPLSWFRGEITELDLNYEFGGKSIGMFSFEPDIGKWEWSLIWLNTPNIIEGQHLWYYKAREELKEAMASRGLKLIARPKGTLLTMNHT